MDNNEILQQHIEGYKKSIIDIINNNTEILIDGDIKPLFKKPPLDSMDLIKSKILDLSKSNKCIIDIDKLSTILDNYRKMLSDCCDEIGKIRKVTLIKIVEDTKIINQKDIIKINKKDFTDINKKIRTIIKKELQNSYEKTIVREIDSLFKKIDTEEAKDKVISGITKYLKGIYQKQILESMDIKILVKDTTLINGVKEQTERYLFTINNSRLFKI